MTPEAITKLHTEVAAERSEFRLQLLKDIPLFHRLYSKYHDPLALETARNLGKVIKNITHKND